jgi:5S rRNA maturation endonuclease (ribonuclease M5)
MNFENEVKSLVRQAVMQEINDLGIRATIRERISETGLTDKEIGEMIESTIDSYVKSAVHTDIEQKIRSMFDDKIEKTVEKAINRVIGANILGWGGERKVEEALQREINSAINRGFNIKVEISQKHPCTTEKGGAE